MILLSDFSLIDLLQPMCVSMKKFKLSNLNPIALNPGFIDELEKIKKYPKPGIVQNIVSTWDRVFLMYGP